MTCPGDAGLLHLVEGALPPHELHRMDAHLDRCARCQSAVDDLLRVRTGAASPEPALNAQDGAGEPGTFDAGRRYVVLGHLASGGMGHVHRALDRLTGTIVALKHVQLHGAPDREEAGAAAHLAALAQEFRTLATLRHPNVISVLDYGLGAEKRPFFTMELLDGAEPVLPFAAGAPLAAQVDLLVQLLRALAYLHRRGILHRDLKPSNILVLPRAEGGPHLKVLDFGLSTGNTDLSRYRAAGTLPYMAPELLRAQAASEASDVYAAGVVACEVLAGRHPFAGWTSGPQLVRKVLSGAPDLQGLSQPLQLVLGAMLARSPASRPSPAEILRALSEATGIPVPNAPRPVRDSHLVAAKLVGRASELEELDRALAAAREGQGSAWLVGGESGAGKSRLLDELRTRALVEGVIVAQGQAAPGVGTAYGVWRGLLPILALHVELSDEEASVLGTIVPGLGALLEREVRPPPELDAQGARCRLSRVLGDVVGRARDPVLLLLEDVQWADAESLELLAQVSADAPLRPLMIAASHRDDEAPRLPLALPGMRVMRLPRLERPSVARLCESMLGAAGRDPALVDLITRESEGNAYFIVEGMRALAEESGGLDDVGRRGLPERILAGGVERVLDRRLARVPEEARGLLRLAAVAGRRLDLAVLSIREPGVDALAQACADAGVLSIREQVWRFDHDKLRERVLAGLSPDELRALHADLAADMIAAYPDSRPHAARVAYHLREAGRAASAARFYALAGEDALARGAPGEAEGMLEQALALHPARPGSAPDLEQARLYRRLAHARFALGQLHGVDEALRQLCAKVGAPLPTSALGWCVALGRQVAEQAARQSGLARLWPGRRDDPAERALREEMLHGVGVGEVYIWLARPELALLCTVWGLNLEQALSMHGDTAASAALAYILSPTPLWGIGQRYLDRARRRAPPGSRAEIHYLRIQSMIWLHRGRTLEALRCAEQALSLARAAGDDVLCLGCLFHLQLAVVAREDFRRVCDLCHEMEGLALRARDRRSLVLALVGRGSAELLLGELAEAEATLDRALGLLDEDVGPPLSAVVLGLSAHCAVEQGRLEQAEEHAGAAMEAVRRSRLPLEQLRFALFGALNVYLTIGPPERHARRAGEALARLHAIARGFPSAESNAWLFEGRRRMLSGEPAGAASALRRSLRAAARTGSQAEQGYARYWLGQLAETAAGSAHVPEGAAAHYESAHAIFERLGMAALAERALDARRRLTAARAPRRGPSGDRPAAEP